MASKLVLVTGASSGIGEATAKRYAASGAHVLLLARNQERLDKVAEAVRKEGGTATAFPVDLAKAEEIAEVARQITSEIGTPDIIVNNAGAGSWIPLIETTPEDARVMIEVPYLAAFDLTRAFLPDMIARGSGGLVYITSPAAYLVWPNACAYIAARRAIAGLAEALQAELRRTGICVTLVVFGNVKTPYWEHNPGSNVPGEGPTRSLMPEEAADAIFKGAEDRKRLVVKPSIFRLLFVLNALFPRFIASQVRQAMKNRSSA
jgi:uncharacterized protein